MISHQAISGWLRPWRVAAALLMFTLLALSPLGRAEAAVGVVFTLTDNTVSVQTAG
ncbi:MAG: hypothetical protein O2919_00760 [Chloroflexi bacterium]|nr:hypothetical protein [Chloroflexota bacterium]